MVEQVMSIVDVRPLSDRLLSSWAKLFTPRKVCHHTTAGIDFPIHSEASSDNVFPKSSPLTSHVSPHVLHVNLYNNIHTDSSS